MDKAWYLFGVNGVGRVVAWIDPATLSQSRIEAENLTAVVPTRDGVGFQKLAASGSINLDACGLWAPAPDEIRAPLSELWDKIIMAEQPAKVNFRA